MGNVSIIVKQISKDIKLTQWSDIDYIAENLISDIINQDDVKYYSYYHRLVGIINELMENAFKFSNKEDPVISLKIKRENNDVTMEVINEVSVNQLEQLVKEQLVLSDTTTTAYKYNNALKGITVNNKRVGMGLIMLQEMYKAKTYIDYFKENNTLFAKIITTYKLL